MMIDREKYEKIHKLIVDLRRKYPSNKIILKNEDDDPIADIIRATHVYIASEIPFHDYGIILDKTAYENLVPALKTLLHKISNISESGITQLRFHMEEIFPSPEEEINTIKQLTVSAQNILSAVEEFIKK